MEKNELKTQALLERVSSLTTQYENQIADLRVELTMTAQERDFLKSEVESYRAAGEDANVPQEDSSED